MTSKFNILWQVQLGTPYSDIPSAIGIDSNENSYIVGNTDGMFVNNNIAPANQTFIAKYDANGIQKWGVQFGNLADVYGTDITVDTSGNSYIIGYTSTAIGTDAYVTKYDTNGNRLWLQPLSTSSDDTANGVAVDINGNTFVVGGTKGTFSNNTRQGNSGTIDAFIAQYDTSGNQVWIKQFHPGDVNDNGVPISIAVDSASNSYTLSNVNKITKFDKFGNQLWNIDTYDSPSGIAVGSSGNVYATGNNINGLPNSNGYNTTNGGNDVWIAKYDNSGTLVWAKSFGTPSNDYSKGITVDTQDNAHITGYTQGGSLSGTNIGGADAFVAKYDSNGNQVSLQQFGSTLDDKSQDIAYSNTTGNLYLTGSTTGNLGGSNAGAIDTWVVKDGPALTNDMVYRFYNARTQQHFYTANIAERDSIINTPSIGYAFEGGAFGASISNGPGLLPLYRFYSGSNQNHFYTTNESEKNGLISNTQSGYAFEGVAFYVYGGTSNVVSPVNRYYNPKIAHHLFTGNTLEIAGLSTDWVSEGVAFRASL